MNRYICIHGHFYQPPRENPWLGEVELQDSAYPYHDWNKRISAECYSPNTAARNTDNSGNILEIRNNYAKISFNFGPTLLSWLERHEPQTYNAIIEADKLSKKKFSGHGSALAQGYNHMILPLATTQDKWTQIIWGIKDFEMRFKRSPEGMWLPETAVDLESLDIMAQCGIRFTILAPQQAHRVRRLGDPHWHDVSGSRIDPKRPYLCRLNQGRSIVIFFYDGPISRDIAFCGLLKNGETFARRLTGAFADNDATQLVHISTDGETYGHHHHFGDMALAYCLDYLETQGLAKLTIYGEYVDTYPPDHEVEIYDNSSWSCVHGIERWRSACGCNSGGKPGWHQEWRAPLRGALDWLRDTAADIYKEKMGEFIDDPWKTRNAYIDSIQDRSPVSINRFFERCGMKDLSHQDKTTCLKLLEMQHQCMLMYTSCGWFFDEISGLETVQILLYSARALQLAQELSDIPLEEAYVKLLAMAPSNIPRFKNGAGVYEQCVRPYIIDLWRVGAHYAICQLFHDFPEISTLFSYTANRKALDIAEAGKQRLAIGRVKIRSTITWEEKEMTFAVLYMADHNIKCGIRAYTDTNSYLAMQKELKDAFLKADIPETISILGRHFTSSSYSLRHLFRDEQRNILASIIDFEMQELQALFRQIYDHNYPIMHMMNDLCIPLPKVLSTSAEYILNADLKETLEKEELDLEAAARLVSALEKWGLQLDGTTLNYIVSRRINQLVQAVAQDPGNENLIKKTETAVEALCKLPLDLNIWEAQNIYFSTEQQLLRRKITPSEHFNRIGTHLKVKNQ